MDYPIHLSGIPLRAPIHRHRPRLPCGPRGSHCPIGARRSLAPPCSCATPRPPFRPSSKPALHSGGVPRSRHAPSEPCPTGPAGRTVHKRRSRTARPRSSKQSPQPRNVSSSQPHAERRRPPAGPTARASPVGCDRLLARFRSCRHTTRGLTRRPNDPNARGRNRVNLEDRQILICPSTYHKRTCTVFRLTTKSPRVATAELGGRRSLRASPTLVDCRRRISDLGFGG